MYFILSIDLIILKICCGQKIGVTVGFGLQVLYSRYTCTLYGIRYRIRSTKPTVEGSKVLFLTSIFCPQQIFKIIK